MTRINNIRGITAVAALLGSLALASVTAYAQTSAPAAPAEKQGDGTMNGNGGMMMNPETQQKMTRMMDNCNRMMESMGQNTNGTTAPASPATKG